MSQDDSRTVRNERGTYTITINRRPRAPIAKELLPLIVGDDAELWRRMPERPTCSSSQLRVIG